MEFQLQFRELVTQLDDLSCQLKMAFCSVSLDLLFDFDALTSHFVLKFDQFQS